MFAELYSMFIDRETYKHKETGMTFKDIFFHS